MSSVDCRPQSHSRPSNCRGAAVAWLIVLVSVCAFGWILLQVVSHRIRGGDIYPAYSTFNSSPRGLKALHDLLESQPSLRVNRHLGTTTQLQADAATLVVVAGIREETFRTDEQLLDSLESLLQRGTDVAVFLLPRAEYRSKSDEQFLEGSEARERRLIEESEQRRAGMQRDEQRRETLRRQQLRPQDKSEGSIPEDDKQPPAAADDSAPADDTNPDETESFPKSPRSSQRDVETFEQWQVTIIDAVRAKTEEDRGPIESAERVEAAPASLGLPEAIQIYGSQRLQFSDKSDWQAWLETAGQPVAGSRMRGQGRLLVVADTYLISNESLAAQRPAQFINAVIGDARTVTFMESHLGVVDNRSIADLARGYGLAPAMVSLLVLFGLIVWHRAADLVPAPTDAKALPAPSAGVQALGALVQRALAPTDLPRRIVDTAAHLPKRLRPSDAKLQAMRMALEDAAWGKRRPSIRVLYNELAKIARRPDAPAALTPAVRVTPAGKTPSEPNRTNDSSKHSKDAHN